MGICASNDLTPDQKAKLEEDQKKDKIIKQQMDKDQVSDQKTYKLLLLGAGESGKSTLFKQMLTIYGQGVTQEELQALIGPIHTNILVCIVQLCLNVERWGQVLPENEEALRHFQQHNLTADDIRLDPMQFQYISQLWSDPSIQTCWDHRSEFQIYDSTQYFLDKVNEIKSPDYQPTEQDHLRIRVRTTGIVESAFAIDGNNFKLHDVGGQRNERKKWIHCFENVTAVIFVAAISEYDQKLFEDETTNRLDEALKLFGDICNSRWFQKTSLLLFLNKRDLFQEKIMRAHLKDWFPAYTGPSQDYQAAQEWICDQFKSKNRNKDQVIYDHCTTATDTHNVRTVFNAVKDIIIRNALKSAGLLT